MAHAELKVGDEVPAVTLPLQDGKTVALSSLRGQQVALYFYPKDDTAGCTVEATGIRDSWAELQKAKVKVYGVSLQDAASHKAFIEKNKLPFDLVVDKDGSLAKAFGVPVTDEKAARQTILIGADGKVKKIWRSVSPPDHAKQLIEAAHQST